MSILATKSIEEISLEQLGAEGTGGLRRVLGPGQLVMLGVGAVIGTGIFVLTGQAAAANAGPAIVISMVLAGLTSVLAALCYSEFAASVPVANPLTPMVHDAGGVCRVGDRLGPDPRIRSGSRDRCGRMVRKPRDAARATWLRVSSRSQCGAGHRRHGCRKDPVTAVFNLPAVIITAIVTCLLIFGVRESASVNSAIVVVKVAVVLIVIGAGAMFIDRANWHPFIPENTGRFGEYGWSGILRGAGVIFFADIGFDAVSTSAQEARNPQRDMPRGILGSLAVCTVLYVLVSAVMVGLVVQGHAQRARAARRRDSGSRRSRRRYAVVDDDGGDEDPGHRRGACRPQLGDGGDDARSTADLLAMSKDGLMPRWAGKVHPRFHTPHVSTLVTGVVVAMAAAFTPIGALGNLVSIGTLMAFVIVSMGIIVLRRTPGPAASVPHAAGAAPCRSCQRS